MLGYPDFSGAYQIADFLGKVTQTLFSRIIRPISQSITGAADQRRTRRRVFSPQRPPAAAACSKARIARPRTRGCHSAESVRGTRSVPRACYFTQSPLGCDFCLGEAHPDRAPPGCSCLQVLRTWVLEAPAPGAIRLPLATHPPQCC
jgi:hypothetical protein